MGFNWTEQATKEGPTSVPIPDGTHRVTITKIIHAGKGNEEFMTKNGDKQMLVIFADAGGREAPEYFTLNAAAGFRVAKLAAAAGLDLEKMEASNITPESFGDTTFAEKNLLGRELTIEVGSREYKGKKQMTVNPIIDGKGGKPSGPRMPKPASPYVKEPSAEYSDDSIPF